MATSLTAVQGAGLGYAPTVCAGTHLAAPRRAWWTEDGGADHRATVDRALTVDIDTAIRVRDWARARLLAAALNLSDHSPSRRMVRRVNTED